MTEQVIANEENNRFHCKRKKGRNTFMGTENRIAFHALKQLLVHRG